VSRLHCHWTPDEDAFLAANYGVMTGAELALALDRTKETVWVRARTKGLAGRAGRVCGFCRTALPWVGRGRRPAYCSPDCRYALRQAYAWNDQHDARVAVACEWCGELVPPKLLGRPSQKRRWCSRGCNKAAWHDRNKDRPERRVAQRESKRRYLVKRRPGTGLHRNGEQS
jgi:hypothetical protein